MHTVKDFAKEAGFSPIKTTTKIKHINQQEIKGPLAIPIERLLRQLKKDSGYADSRATKADILSSNKIPEDGDKGEELIQDRKTKDISKSLTDRHPLPSAECTELTR